MTDAAHNPDDYCYRHPDRLSFVLCERCGRTICLECQNHVGGRVLCPDDARTANVTMMPVNPHPRVKREPSRVATIASRVTADTPLANYIYGAVLLLVWIADAIAGSGVVESRLWFFGNVNQPWTLLTHAISEYPGAIGFLDLLFNAFTLWFLGRRVEQEFGRLKFLLVIVVSALGAGVFAFLLNGYILDASDAILGLIGAAVVLIRRHGYNPVWLYASIGISFLSILLGPGGSVLWQGAVGGLVAGGAIGLSFALDGTPARIRQQRLVAIGVIVVLLVLLVTKFLVAGRSS